MYLASGAKWWAAVVTVFAAVVSDIVPARAADAGARDVDVIEEIVVTGTRRAGRTVFDSASPIDLVSAADLKQAGSLDVNELLRGVIPSFNVKPLELHDGATFVRPATLRGLPPDSTLVLVNGKRRHRSAVIAIFGGADAAGSQGPDLNMIPVSAIDRIEVLRDGAAAQYGADAIAGVINVLLKEDREGMSVDMKLGRYGQSDGLAGPLLPGHGTLYRDLGHGDTANIAANLGLALGDRGFLNASLEWSEVDPTSRSVQLAEVQAQVDAGQTGLRNPAQVFGRPRIRDDYVASANFGIELSEVAELYGHTSYGTRKVRNGFFFRNPDNRDGIYTRGTNASGQRLRLVGDLTGDLTGNCIGNPASNPDDPELVVGDAAGLQAVMADPDCFVFNEILPFGFTPEFQGDLTDFAMVLGYRTELANRLGVDASIGYGLSQIDYSIFNTVNATYGPSTPLEHRPGDHRQSDLNLNIDFSYDWIVANLASPIHLAFGAEWRQEQFQVNLGGQSSWEAGILADQGFTVGSSGFQGFSPFQAGKHDTENLALYVDVEADLSDRLLLGVAARYERFDTFGSEVTGKVSSRFRLTDGLNLRATLSTGFRSPTIGQQQLVNTFTAVAEGAGLQTQGLIPPTNPIAQLFGARPLGPERAVSASVGFTADLFDRIDLAVDLFQIDVEDRISQSADINILSATIPGLCSPDTVSCSAALEATGIPGASEIVAFSFYTNDFDTRTRGLDVIASTSLDLSRLGTTDITLGFNWTDTSLESYSPEVIDRSTRLTLEKGRPSKRANIGVVHSLGNWDFRLKVNWHDEWGFYRNLDLIDQFGEADVFVDAEVAYTWKDRYTFAAGGENVFDEYPTEMCAGSARSPSFCEQVLNGNKYVWGAPFGNQGAFWYVRLGVDL